MPASPRRQQASVASNTGRGLSAKQRAEADAAFAEYEKSSPALQELRAGRPSTLPQAALSERGDFEQAQDARNDQAHEAYKAKTIYKQLPRTLGGLQDEQKALQAEREAEAAGVKHLRQHQRSGNMPDMGKQVSGVPIENNPYASILNRQGAIQDAQRESTRAERENALFNAEMARRAQIGAETQFNPKAQAASDRRAKEYASLAAPKAPERQIAGDASKASYQAKLRSEMEATPAERLSRIIELNKNKRAEITSRKQAEKSKGVAKTTYKPMDDKQVASNDTAPKLTKAQSGQSVLGALVGLAKQAATVRTPTASRPTPRPAPAPRPAAAPRPQIYRGAASSSVQPGSRLNGTFNYDKSIGGTSHDAPVQRNQVTTQFRNAGARQVQGRGGPVEVLSAGARENYNPRQPGSSVSLGTQANSGQANQNGQYAPSTFSAQDRQKDVVATQAARQADAAKAPGQLQFEQAMEGNFSGSNYDETQRKQIASMRKDKKMSANPQVAYQEWMKRQQNQQDLAALPDPYKQTST